MNPYLYALAVVNGAALGLVGSLAIGWLERRKRVRR
jgi:hypothetical protein